MALKNVTITVEEEVARWARLRAAEENTSVSKLVGQMLREDMRRSDDYWKAYERFKKWKPIPGIDAANRMTREEAHERDLKILRRHQRSAVRNRSRRAS